MKHSHKFTLLLAACIMYLAAAEPAWAVQSHGGIEGLVVHQLGHVLFAGGVVYLLYHQRRLKQRLKEYTSFEFTMFLWFMLAWNFLTFVGHALREYANPANFIYVDGELFAYTINDFADVLFYLSRLDHLLLVPSFIFLLLALKKWEHP